MPLPPHGGFPAYAAAFGMCHIGVALGHGGTVGGGHYSGTGRAVRGVVLSGTMQLSSAHSTDASANTLRLARD
jgi:hypothetical protein